ncbi:MAG: acyl-CoA dehydrogenase family protein [Methyloligellaceae bacterium]
MNEWSKAPGENTLPQPETRGLNLYRADPSVRALLRLYLADDERIHMEPTFERLGDLVGDRLDDLAHAADRNPPRLSSRDRQGRDRQSLERHPSYRELERMAYGEFALAGLSHRPAFGWNAPLSPHTKYALTYLFAQSEFGLLCPVNMTDSLTRTIRRFADDALLDRFLPDLLTDDPERLTQGAMFMTERFAGSDVGATETRAVKEGDHWRLYGDKWFCSNADAGIVLVLARPEGAGEGTGGLGLFLMPRLLGDGAPNHFRIVRLKDKLGTRSMASGEIVLEGAVSYLVGDLADGFKQMAEMMNQSRLSNGVRSAGMMRRAAHEAFAVACGRQAFGQRLIDLPLVRRQLAKMILPAEQALSMAFFTGECLAKADEGDAEAQTLRRILTPLIKFRACRDARKVAGDAMEMRGGCGYVEEWIESRLVRDTHLGSIWEGTSNIVALDVVRACRKARAHEALAAALEPMIAAAPEPLRGHLEERLAASMELAGRVAAADGGKDALARQAATALYNVTTAALFCREAERLSSPVRLALAELALRHRLSAQDPIAADAAGDAAAVDVVLNHLLEARATA